MRSGGNGDHPFEVVGLAQPRLQRVVAALNPELVGVLHHLQEDGMQRFDDGDGPRIAAGGRCRRVAGDDEEDDLKDTLHGGD